MQSSWRAILLIFLALVGGGVLGYVLMPKTEEGADTPAVAAAPAAAVEPAINPEPQQPEVAAIQEPQAAPARLEPPTFDVVRIEQDGSAVIAGRAPAGATISLLLDDAAIAETSSDSSGSFVLLTTIPPSGQARVLALRTQLNGQEAISDETVIVSPRPVEVAEAAPANPSLAPDDDPAVAGAGSAAEVETDTGDGVEVSDAVPSDADTGNGSPGDVAAAGADAGNEIAAAGAPQAATASAEPPGEPATGTEPVAAPQTDAGEDVVAEAVAEPAAENPVTQSDAETADDPGDVPGSSDGNTAPLVVIADSDGVSVLSDVSPDAMSNVALDTITYDAEGAVTLGGRAPGEGFVRVYLDDQPITTSRIGPDGDWRTALPDVDTGVYQLRVDEVTEEGVVTSRIETPFLREEPEVVRETLEDLAESGLQAKVRTVQPGNTLWAIARDRYGAGSLYVKVFEANREQIRNPDLIYPGQVFTLPE